MTCIASSALVELWYTQEDANGDIPANPEWRPIRYTTHSLALAANRISSEEIRGDRHRTADRRGTFNAAGDINTHLFYGAHDDFFLASFCALNWTVKAVESANVGISFIASDNSLNIASGFLAMGFEVGDVVTVLGGAEAGNDNVTADIVSITDTKIVLSNKATLSDEAAGEAISIVAQEQLITGVTRRTFAILERHTDKNIDYLFRGMEFNVVTLSGVNSEKWEVTFSLIGRSQEQLLSLPAGSTFVPLTTTDFMTTLDGNYLIDGLEYGYITEFTASIDNGITPKYAVGSATAVCSSIAPITAQGTNNAWFDSEELYNRFLEDTATVVRVNMTDGVNCYRLHVPYAKFVEGSKAPSGDDVVVSLTYSAGYNAESNTEFLLEKFTYEPPTVI